MTSTYDAPSKLARVSLQGDIDLQMILPSSLVFLPHGGGGWWDCCDLRGVQGLIAAVDILTRPNPGRAETRPLPMWRWRDALFEDPFGRSLGRTKLRSQAAIGPCGLPIA